MQPRPSFLLPALGLAIAVAVVFFKIYGRVTRPDVPLPVSATVEHFAPGVAIGSTLKESKKKLGDVRWIHRQAQLLSASHSIRVRPAWGETD